MNVMNRLCLFLLLVCCAHLDASAQDRSRFLRWMKSDVSALGSSVLRHAPAASGAAAGLLMGAQFIDPVMNDGVRAWSSGSVDRFLDSTNPMGGPAVTAKVAGVFGLTLLLGDAKSQNAAFTSLESLLLAGGLSYGLKYAFGRGRPDEGYAPNHFEPFSGHSSFPSGHTTTAFAIIVPWAVYYRTPVARGLLLLPLGTALARLDRDKHWATDVLAGGTIGSLTAIFLARRHQGRTQRSRGNPAVRVAPGHASISFRF
ncbi:MAG: membrane-associated phospholipid phosphatase [Rhodothermales bacterium]|jgi:membrane-associated phospholipid phosphatase